jgi:hypothetical protein
MVVRSCASIAAGEEVTISYLASHTLAPLASRRAMLARTTLDGRGFTCNCHRWVNSRLQQHLLAAAATAFLLEVTAGMNYRCCCVYNHNHRLAHTRDGETHACHTAYVTLLVFELLPPCGQRRRHCIGMHPLSSATEQVTSLQASLPPWPMHGLSRMTHTRILYVDTHLLTTAATHLYEPAWHLQVQLDSILKWSMCLLLMQVSCRGFMGSSHH